jgi:signal transduction histidine kinase
MDSRVAPDLGDVRATHVARVLAPAIVALVVMLDVAGYWSQRGSSNVVLLFALILSETVIAAVVGLLIVRRHPRHAVGWLLLAHGLLVAIVLGGEDQAEGVSPGIQAWISQLGQGSWVFLYVCLAMIGYLFPDGRFLNRRWRRFVLACLACYGLFLVAAAFDVESFHDAYPTLDPPLRGLPPAVAGSLGAVGLFGIAASLVGAVVCARSRLRRSDADERVRILWFAWAALAIPVGLVVCWLDYWITRSSGRVTLLGVTVAGSVLPLAIGVGILRHRLFDIELALSRTLTYGALTVVVIATYGAVLQGLGALVDDRGAGGLVAVGIVAAGIQPVHARVRRRAERWVYGERSDPYAALRRLSDRLDQTPDPAQVIQTVTGSVAEALRVDYVAVELNRGRGPVRAAHGVRGRGSMVLVPLDYRGERLGDLAVEVPPGRHLTVADRRVLDDLARHAGVAVNAVHLTLDLQRSRARLVTAQEEERRRLRRELHDGLGPSLAAIVLKLNAVDAMVRDHAPGRLLAELREETKAAITEVRRLVDDLRPPALDEVGLVAALRQKAASLSRPGGSDAGGEPPLVVVVEGPAFLPPLPAAVEVAAYRIATEALTNVARHSAAARCVVTLMVNGALEVSVADNGIGPRNGTRAGVGWISMRERAAELGGSCTITRRPEGGTLVRAVLPLPDARPHSTTATVPRTEKAEQS